MKQPNNKKKGIIIVVLVLLILVGVSLYFIFSNKLKDNNNIEDRINEKGLTIDDTSNYTNRLTIYYDKNEDFFCYYDDITKCSNKKVYINTESEDARVYDQFLDKYVFYKDNDKVKVYNNYSKKSYVINIATNYYSYSFNTDDLSKQFVGIIYLETDESFASYYSVIDDKIIYDKVYKEMMFLSSDYVTGSEFTCENAICREIKTNLLSTKENKVLLSHTFKKKTSGYYEENLFYELLRNEKGTYICLSTFIDATIYEEIYNTDYKKLQEDIGEFSASINSDGYLYIEKNGVVTAYNKDGDIVKKSDKNNILQLIDNYIVTIKNDKLVLMTIDGNYTDIIEWNKNKNIYNVYYSKSTLEKGKKKIVLGVIDSSVTIDDVWNACDKNNACEGYTKEDIKNYYDLGYLYYFDVDTKTITKVPIYM